MSCPENTNFLSPFSFLFFVKKIPNVNFFVQKVNIPGMSILPTVSENPFVKINNPADKIEYNELNVVFKVDEYLKNYIEMFTWIKEIGFPNSHEERKGIEQRSKVSGLGIYSDATILVLDSNKTSIIECTFINTMPVMLSDIQFDTAVTDVNYLTAEAMFVYDSYDIKVL